MYTRLIFNVSGKWKINDSLKSIPDVKGIKVNIYTTEDIMEIIENVIAGVNYIKNVEEIEYFFPRKLNFAEINEKYKLKN